MSYTCPRTYSVKNIKGHKMKTKVMICVYSDVGKPSSACGKLNVWYFLFLFTTGSIALLVDASFHKGITSLEVCTCVDVRFNWYVTFYENYLFLQNWTIRNTWVLPPDIKCLSCIWHNVFGIVDF